MGARFLHLAALIAVSALSDRNVCMTGANSKESCDKDISVFS